MFTEKSVSCPTSTSENNCESPDHKNIFKTLLFGFDFVFLFFSLSFLKIFVDVCLFTSQILKGTVFHSPIFLPSSK